MWARAHEGVRGAGCSGAAGRRRAVADTWSRLLFHLYGGASIDALVSAAVARAATPDAAGFADGALATVGGAVARGEFDAAAVGAGAGADEEMS